MLEMTSAEMLCNLHLKLLVQPLRLPPSEFLPLEFLLHVKIFVRYFSESCQLPFYLSYLLYLHQYIQLYMKTFLWDDVVV